MPWRSVDQMELRQALIEKALTGRFQVTELAHAFGVSRKTAHKWIGRHREGGMAALADRSHARLGGTDRVSEEITQAIIDCRARHPTWGPKKIAVIVRTLAKPDVRRSAPLALCSSARAWSTRGADWPGYA